MIRRGGISKTAHPPRRIRSGAALIDDVQAYIPRSARPFFGMSWRPAVCRWNTPRARVAEAWILSSETSVFNSLRRRAAGHILRRLGARSGRRQTPFPPEPSRFIWRAWRNSDFQQCMHSNRANNRNARSVTNRR